MTSIIRLFLISLLMVTAVHAQVRIIQTNSGSANIHIIDATTHKIVGEIKNIPINHGAAAAPDGSRLYFSGEADRTLDVVDVKTLNVIKKIPLSGRPNNIAISKDGRKVYVGIASQPGAVDVIDTMSLEKAKSIATRGGIHNVYVTPDGKYMVAGSIAGRNMGVYDTATDELAWSLFEQGVRPMAFETNPDGSTKRAFVQLSEFHGFVVVDFAQRKEVARITLPELPVEQRHTGTFNGSPSHGLGVAPDGKSLWVTSRINSRVYGYSLPDLKLLGDVEIGKEPDWVTFTPDSKLAYISSSGNNTVSAVDITTRKEVARITVGTSPKRVITATLR
jgi:YVTN family beta-propeller protein